MLTIFSTPKPFEGHNGVIQRNALKSWTLLHPDCEVILFGNEPGAREVAVECGIRHVPDVLHSEYGSTRLDYLFAHAQQTARHDLLCYANCDIIFLDSFVPAIASVAAWSKRFLLVGRRWNTPLDDLVDFDEPDWRMRLRDLAMSVGKEQFPGAVDYFVFSRGLYQDVPPFVAARTHWDHWMVWKARYMSVPVIDASADVLAIHQNHDYSYHLRGLQGVKTDPESRLNRALAGGQPHLYTIEHATHRLRAGRIENIPGRWHVPVTFFLRTYSSQVWYWVLKTTFSLRQALRLNRNGLSGVQRRFRSLMGGQ